MSAIDERYALELREAALTAAPRRPVNIGVLCSDVHPGTSIALTELDADGGRATSTIESR